MKKSWFALPLVLALAGCTAHADVTISHPKSPTISWGTSCRLNMELPGSVALGNYPELFATVKITNTGKSIQGYSSYRVYFWSGGIIVGFWNGHFGMTYESPGEWTSMVSNVNSASGASNAVEPPGSPVSGAGVWSAVYEPTGRLMTCTVANVTS